LHNANSNMKRLWRAIEFLAWAGFFSFAALVLALRFWILPDIESQRERIVAAITRSVGLPVRIGRIEAGWLGLNPQLNFSDVRVLDAQGREALVLPIVENVLSWRALVTGEFRLHSLAIEGPRLTVRRDTEGSIYVAGIKLAGRGDGSMSDWILGQDEIVVRNAEIEWRDEKRGAPPLALSSLNLRLRNAGDEHSVGFSARPPAELGSGLELRAELAGRTLARPDAWNGRVYLEVGYTDLAGWRAWVDYPVDVRKGQGALRLWTTLENGSLTQATADVALAGVAARLGKDLPLIELAAVTGRIQAAQREGGYEIAGRKLALVSERGPGIDPTDFQLSWKPASANGNEPERGSFAAKVVELEPFARLAETLPLPAEVRKLLADLAPRGRFLDAKLEWTGRLADPAKFSGKGAFSDLALRPWGQVPGFSGLSGSIEASETKGSLQLASRKAELDLPRLLAEPHIRLDTLEGQLDFARTRPDSNAFSVRLGSLAFANEHFEGKASGSYAWPGEGRGTVDLDAALKRGDGAQVVRYLPLAEVIGKPVHDYLAGAIIAGKASDVRLRIKGDLRDFPFADAARGEFRASARVEKGVLEYVPGWPRIYDIDAELLFERDRMQIVGRSASVLGAKLANVRVGIASLAERPVTLNVSGQADGPTSEFLKFVETSPVRRMVGGFTDGMHADGRGKLRLKLALPLADLAGTKVEGDYEMFANTVNVRAGLPPIERASGRIGFTESTLVFQDVKGRFVGGPVSISGGSRAGAGVEVQAKGDASVAGTQAIFDHPWRRYLSGAAPYTASVTVREGRARVSFESSLRGVTSTLPPPLSKGAAETLPLRVEVIPAEGGARDRVSIVAGRIVAAELLRLRQGDAMSVQRASVWLSPVPEQPVRVPERPGLLVYGALSELDLDRWLALAGSETPKPGADAPRVRPSVKARPRTSSRSARWMFSANGSTTRRCARARTPPAGRRP
jgi:uncharacterized protein (TIGR02099 family)